MLKNSTVCYAQLYVDPKTNFSGGKKKNTLTNQDATQAAFFLFRMYSVQLNDCTNKREIIAFFQINYLIMKCSQVTPVLQKTSILEFQTRLDNSQDSACLFGSENTK